MDSKGGNSPVEALSTLVALDAPLAFGLGREAGLSASPTSVFDRLGRSIADAVARASGLDQIGESFLQAGADASGMSQLGKMVADAAARASGLDQIGESFLKMAGLAEMQRLASTFSAPEWAYVAMEAVADLRDGGAAEVEMDCGRVEGDRSFGADAAEAGRNLLEKTLGPDSELTDADRAFVRWYAAVLSAAILFYGSLLLPEAAELANESVWVVAFGIAVYRATKRKLPPGAA